MHAARRLLLAVSVLVAGVLGGAAVADAATRTVIFNMYPGPLTRPDRVFFQANSGPYLKDLKWVGWGTSKAVGTGMWTLDCTNGGGSCGESQGVESHPARYILTGLTACPRFGAGGRTYRIGMVEVDDPADPRSFRFDSDSDFCLKPLTLAQAKGAVIRYLRLRGPARRIRLRCVAHDLDYDCHASWTQGAHRFIHQFGVSPQRGKPPRVTRYGI